MELTFEWDATKAESNLRKHGVGFQEGRTVFGDPLMLTFPDPDHTDAEQRFVSIGLSSRGRLLIVIHTERSAKVRIISCRRATAKERKVYEQEAY